MKVAPDTIFSGVCKPFLAIKGTFFDYPSEGSVVASVASTPISAVPTLRR